MSGENSNLLIDFSSPVVKETHKPLIPMPCIKGSLAISPSNNNPFDILATQSESRLLQNDPFELVFRTAFQDVCEINIDSPKDKNLNNLDNDISVEKPHQTSVTNNDKDLKEQCSPSPGNSIDGSGDNISKISFGDCSSIKLDDSDYITEIKHSQRCLPEKINLETSRSETENKSQGLEDFSSEESLKAVIATRVNKCIERVLNNTGVSEKLYKTTDDLNESKTVSSYKVEQKHYRRSLSTSVIRNEFLQDYNNKSFVGGIFILKNGEQIVPPRKATESTTSSSPNTSQSFGCLNKGFLNSRPTISSDELFSPVVDNKSVIGDESVFLSNDQRVFNEANKLANTFSEIATAFNHCQSRDPERDDENDLMSCKPEFLYADSSEDEAELLRKDPSLNFQSRTVPLGLSQSFTNDKNPKVDSEALSRFKNRSKDFVSEDLEKPSNLPKDTALRRSHSWDTPMVKTTPQPRLHIPVGVVNSDDSSGVNQLRVKKVSVEPIRRGPLKAVLPVQNMTRPLELRGGNVPNKEVSTDEPIQQPKKFSIVTPLKKNKQMKEPIAASTPNKSRSASLLTAHVSPIPVAVNNQRHSLDSKNYLSIPMNSSMKRSNSTSGASNSQVHETTKNGNVKTFEKKKPGLQAKFGGKSKPNPRALSDLTKSPLPKTIPTKASSKLLSKLKKGIGMNSISKDKENRLPV